MAHEKVPGPFLIQEVIIVIIKKPGITYWAFFCPKLWDCKKF
jgi:hypothetical protein